MEGVRAEALGQTELAFDDLVNQFNASQDPPCVEEALESEHRAHAAFYPPMILFDNIVQVGASANLDGIIPTVMDFVFTPMRRNAAWVASKPSWSSRPYN